jgi:starch synthase (maltosyl-transferring)
VEPADTCCAHIIYNAFVRQFGPTKSGLKDTHNLDKECLTLDQKGYTVIPPSGTFRNLISELDFIIEELGSRIIQLLPIHPTPTTYARMGRFGSPYASLSFTAVDPALAEFDPRATPLEQFIELVDAIHARKAKIFLDMRSTIPAGPLLCTNPTPNGWPVKKAARLKFRAHGGLNGLI